MVKALGHSRRENMMERMHSVGGILAWRQGCYI
jgi:hypothetical protein